MSNIKLVHSGGNSVSLTTPDSNPAANRTFKLPGADGSSGQFLKTDGSGALSFATPSLPTQPHAFAFMDSQYFTTSATKLAFNTSNSGDISSSVTIDRTNERLTPTVAGTYLVQTQLMFSYSTGGSNIQFVVFQYKNGSEYAYNTQDQYRGSGLVSNVICQSLMTFNGSSDYVEMWAKHNGGGNATMGTASTFMITRIG
jgi:hypothetical protein